MADEQPHICRTCAWAEWERSSTGAVRRRVCGRCTYKVPLPLLPLCATYSTHKTAIWYDFDRRCPVWKGKE